MGGLVDNRLLLVLLLASALVAEERLDVVAELDPQEGRYPATDPMDVSAVLTPDTAQSTSPLVEGI